MDGEQRTKSSSLTWRFSLWIVLVILGLSPIAAALSFAAAYHEARRLQDNHLLDVSGLIQSGKLSLVAASAEWPSASRSTNRIAIAYLSSKNAPQTSQNGIIFPSGLGDGLHDIDLRNQRWRVSVKTLGSGARLAVGERTSLRDEIAWDGAMRTLLPMIGLLPFVLVVVLLIAHRALRPIRALANTMDRLDEHTLSPLSTRKIPKELTPFVASTNRLLARLSDTLSHQRRFIADAAHELRTPIAALSLQAQNLSSATNPEDTISRVATVIQATHRINRLLEQLLTLARSGMNVVPNITRVILDDIATEVIQDALPLADSRNVDLGVEHSDSTAVEVDVARLTIVLRNLVDNAVKYVPEGGKVDVSLTCESGAIVCSVRDSGFGIPSHLSQLVTEPFFRIPGNAAPGSGLGLSIITEIVRRNGGEVTFLTTARGFEVRVIFPLPG